MHVYRTVSEQMFESMQTNKQHAHEINATTVRINKC